MKQDVARTAFNEVFRTTVSVKDVEGLETDGNRLRVSRQKESWEVAVKVGAFELIAGLFASEMFKAVKEIATESPPSVASLLGADVSPSGQSTSVDVYMSENDTVSENYQTPGNTPGLTPGPTPGSAKSVTFSNDGVLERVMEANIFTPDAGPDDGEKQDTQGGPKRKRNMSAKGLESAEYELQKDQHATKPPIKRIKKIAPP